MRKAGRRAWSETDLEYASHVTRTLLSDLGFDVEGWTALASVPRNEPEPPVKAKKPRRKRVREPVQLCFAFA
jgi:hypothetical protein